MDGLSTKWMNGYLEEEVYVAQPLGFPIIGHEDKVFRRAKLFMGLSKLPVLGST